MGTTSQVRVLVKTYHFIIEERVTLKAQNTPNQLRNSSQSSTSAVQRPYPEPLGCHLPAVALQADWTWMSTTGQGHGLCLQRPNYCHGTKPVQCPFWKKQKSKSPTGTQWRCDFIQRGGTTLWSGIWTCDISLAWMVALPLTVSPLEIYLNLPVPWS